MNVKIRSVEELHNGCTPECGIYPNVPSSLYFSLNAMNHSTLKRMKRSPAHFRYQKEYKPSDGARLGTAAHTLLFEPEKFKPILPPINPATKAPYGSNTQAWATYAAAHPGALIMGDDEQRSTREQVSALKAHRKIGPMITDPNGINEVTLVWMDEQTETLCKARLDRYVPSVGALDLKTVDISIGAADGPFARQAISLNYHSAQAFYQRGMRACGLPDLSFVFAVVESDRPFGIVAYELGEKTLGAGMSLVNGWLKTLAECRATNEWPSYPDKDLTTLEAPLWYLKQFYEDMD